MRSARARRKQTTERLTQARRPPRLLHLPFPAARRAAAPPTAAMHAPLAPLAAAWGAVACVRRQERAGRAGRGAAAAAAPAARAVLGAVVCSAAAARRRTVVAAGADYSVTPPPRDLALSTLTAVTPLDGCAGGAWGACAARRARRTLTRCRSRLSAPASAAQPLRRQGCGPARHLQRVCADQVPRAGGGPLAAGACALYARLHACVLRSRGGVRGSRARQRDVLSARLPCFCVRRRRWRLFPR
jgi:hypothetical protein